MTGQPAINLPLYWTDAGLPVGVQVIGHMFAEELLISLAAELEQAHPWADRKPSQW
jgi:amidase